MTSTPAVRPIPSPRHAYFGHVNPRCTRCGKTPMEAQGRICVPLVVKAGDDRPVIKASNGGQA